MRPELLLAKTAKSDTIRPRSNTVTAIDSSRTDNARVLLSASRTAFGRSAACRVLTRSPLPFDGLMDELRAADVAEDTGASSTAFLERLAWPFATNFIHDTCRDSIDSGFPFLVGEQRSGSEPVVSGLRRCVDGLGCCGAKVGVRSLEWDAQGGYDGMGSDAAGGKAFRIVRVSSDVRSTERCRMD